MQPLPTTHLAIGPDRFPLLDAGRGPVLVFVHGALTDLRMWEPHVRRLSERFRCLAPTLRWHGTGPWRDDGPGYGVATHAADLVAMVDALGLERVTLVAWSYAGHVALHAAGLRPDRFARLVLFEPGLRSLPLADREAALVGADAQAMFGPIFDAVGRGDLEGAARALIDGSGGPGHFDAVSEARRLTYRDNAHTLPRLLAQEPPPPAAPDGIANLPMPVHVAWGEASRPASLLPAQAVGRCVGRGSVRAIPGAGHLWPEERPDEFSGFVAECAATP